MLAAPGRAAKRLPVMPPAEAQSRRRDKRRLVDRRVLDRLGVPEQVGALDRAAETRVRPAFAPSTALLGTGPDGRPSQASVLHHDPSGLRTPTAERPVA